jgi:hypothetical protein
MDMSIGVSLQGTLNEANRTMKFIYLRAYPKHQRPIIKIMIIDWIKNIQEMKTRRKKTTYKIIKG